MINIITKKEIKTAAKINKSHVRVKHDTMD